MHPAGVGPGQHHAALPVVTHALKLGPAILALCNIQCLKSQNDLVLNPILLFLVYLGLKIMNY